MECLRAALAICATHINNGCEERHRLAFGVIAQSVPHLLRRGLLEELKKVCYAAVPSPRRSLVNCFISLKICWHAIKIGRRFSQGLLATITQKSASGALFFGQRTFADGFGRLVRARSPFGTDGFIPSRPTTRTISTIWPSSILREPAAFLQPNLDWLAGPEAQAVERLGFALGQFDVAEDCGRMIFHHAIAQKTAPLLRGYIRGMVKAERRPNPHFLAEMDRLVSVHPEMSIDILVFAGDNFDALNRILRLIDSKAVSARYLASLCMGLGLRELTADEINRIIPYFALAPPKLQTPRQAAFWYSLPCNDAELPISQNPKSPA